MTKRQNVGWIYFIVVLMTLVMRVSSALDVYSALGIGDADAFWTCIIQVVIFGVLPVGAYLIGARIRKDDFKVVLDDFGVKKLSGINCVRVVVIAICMIVITHALSYVWQIGLMMMGFTHISSSTDYTNIGVLFKELVLVALLPGFFEEITHRGLLHAGYKDSKWQFVFLSALMFSLMHQNIVQTGYTFFSGIVMALTMYYTGSIWCGIFMHTLNNGWAVVSEYISQNGGIFDFINRISDFLYSSVVGIIVLMLLAFGCLMIMIFMFLRMRKSAVMCETVSPRAFERLPLDVKSPFADLPVVLTICVGIVATVFSFVWGITR